MNKAIFDLQRGFLPHADPITHLPAAFAAWEAAAAELPKLLVSQYTRSHIENLPIFPLEKLKEAAQWERAMMILSYLGHAYVWAQFNHPADKIPARLAQPWYQVAKQLGRPPVLSYASYALYNWRRLQPQQPIALGNIALLQNFLGGIDEEWFILIHVDIEAHAVAGLQTIFPAYAAVSANNPPLLHRHLSVIEQTLIAMCATLRRMPEHCDPYIYYHRVRPYIHGWKNNPALPDGLIYEGVDAYQGKPVKFKGETGAQSTIIPVFDSALGVAHPENPLKTHLVEMQDYMPPQHREFLTKSMQEANIRPYIQTHYRDYPPLQTTYNECLKLMHEFRAIHLGYAAQYIQKQTPASKGNPTEVGTGGTPFMEYLRQHKEETERHYI